MNTFEENLEKIKFDTELTITPTQLKQYMHLIDTQLQSFLQKVQIKGDLDSVEKKILNTHYNVLRLEAIVNELKSPNYL